MLVKLLKYLSKAFRDLFALQDVNKLREVSLEYFNNLLNLSYFIYNKRNDKRFNNRGYSLFFLMRIFLKHLWLIPNILKWQNCKIFIKLVPSQTPSRSSHQRCSVKKGGLFKINSNTDAFLWHFEEHLLWRTSANDCFCPS